MIIDEMFKVFILTFLLLLLGCEMTTNMEPEFKVYGESNILNKLTINVESIKDFPPRPYYNESKVQTLLYKNKLHTFQNVDVNHYKIYFSYEGKVGLLEFDNNLFSRGNGQGRVNYIYVYKTENDIFIKHYASEINAQNKDGFESNISAPLDQFFIEKNILDKKEQQLYRERFIEFYEPETQRFLRIPLTDYQKENFKELPMPEKKRRNLLIEDLKNMNLPEDELNELLNSSNNL